jgi:hypothetical protein
VTRRGLTCISLSTTLGVSDGTYCRFLFSACKGDSVDFKRRPFSLMQYAMMCIPTNGAHERLISYPPRDSIVLVP